MSKLSNNNVYLSRAKTCCNSLEIARLYCNYFILTTILFFLIAASAAHSAPNKSKENLNAALYKNAKVLSTQNTQPDADGRVKNQKIVRLDKFKYPLIRLDDTRQLSQNEIKALKKTGKSLNKAGDGEGEAGELISQKAMVANHILVKLQDGVDEKALEKICKKLNARILRKMRAPGMYLVSLNQYSEFDAIDKAIKAFENESAYIKFAEPDFVVQAKSIPDDTDFGSLWGMHNTGQDGGTPDADIDAPEAWDISTGSHNVLVSVLDTGIDYTHPDLVPNIWTNPGEIADNGIDDDGNGYIDDIHGWDFAYWDNDPMDVQSHGTHCAGTIGAVGNNAEGVAGVNWQVTMAAVKILNDWGGGYISDMIEGIVYATTINSDLMSNSWGLSGFTWGIMEVVADASDEGILFVVASGNDSSNNDEDPDYPSSLLSDNVIAVGSTTNLDELSEFSNYGVETVDLTAPGSDIFSTIPGGGYEYNSGTSMAAPHVSGACALLMASEPGLSMLEIKARLLERADRLASLFGKISSMRRLNVYDMLNPAWTPPPTELILYSVEVTDPDGNNNNWPEPLEIVNLDHTFLNLGFYDAENVSMALSCSEISVVVIAPNTISAGAISGYDAATQSQPFQLLLKSGLERNYEIPYTLTLSYDPDYEEILNLSFEVMPGDEYEFDDTPDDINATFSRGETEIHSIHRIGDTDWAKFRTSTDRDITIETSGPSDADTEMWVYGPATTTPTKLIAYDDNSGEGNYARLTFHGEGNWLVKNMYFVKITQKDNKETIDSYNLRIFDPADDKDDYENDDDPPIVDTISLGDLQEDHTLHTIADVDWVRFTIDEMREVKIETDGPDVGFTELTLYGPDSSSEVLGYGTDSDNDYYSIITRTGSRALGPGTYYVKVSGWYQPTNPYSLSLEAYNEPVAIPVASLESAAPNEEITFSNPGSYDPDGDPIFQWEWKLGDTIVSTASSFSQTFETQGTYVLALRVRNVFGVWSQPNYVEVEIFYTGDIDRNGVVNLDDFVLLRNAFGSKPGDSNWNPNADLNGDGLINLTDFVILRNNFTS